MSELHYNLTKSSSKHHRENEGNINTTIENIPDYKDSLNSTNSIIKDEISYSEITLIMVLQILQKTSATMISRLEQTSEKDLTRRFKYAQTKLKDTSDGYVHNFNHAMNEVSEDYKKLIHSSKPVECSWLEDEDDDLKINDTTRIKYRKLPPLLINKTKNEQKDLTNISLFSDEICEQKDVTECMDHLVPDSGCYNCNSIFQSIYLTNFTY